MSGIYLDNNATTAPLPEVAAAIAHVLKFGPLNPSSVHSQGSRARDLIEQARDHVAEFTGARPEQVTFCSGGTEASNTAIRSIARPGVQRIVTSEIEHSATKRQLDELEVAGCDTIRLKTGSDGRIRLDALRSALSMRTAVTLQWVNSETGAIQPIAEVIAAARDAGAEIHVDAAQAAGKLPIRFDEIGATHLTFAGHKLHGPTGVGVIISEDPEQLRPLILGGDQEAGRRAGTEAVHAIVGLGVACRQRHDSMTTVTARMTQLRDSFEGELERRIPGLAVNGRDAPRICNTSNLRFPDVDGQALLAHLDLAGVQCSQGTACTNRRPEPSAALLAMGLSEAQAYASIRFSLSQFTTEEELRKAAELIVAAHRGLTRSPSQLGSTAWEMAQ